MFRTILGSDQVNSSKNTGINKQSYVKFWFNRTNMELSHIHLAVKIHLQYPKKNLNVLFSQFHRTLKGL